jgi:hypothetical protein
MPLENTSFSKDRRQLLQRGIGVAAALPSAWAAKSSGAQTGTPAPRTSAPPAGVLTRTIPRTGESVFNRHAEKRVFPAAQSHGVGVLVNMAMEKGRLHKVVEGHPLPAFAREYGIENWAQYFLKFVMSHPAVTCCLSSTADPDHAAENVGALRGPLPDAATRARMLRHLENLPGFDRIASMPWYPGKDKHYPGFIRRGQASLRLRNVL